ncbi:MAG: TetR/AcrR family transcriptional regulator [Candidatus Spyradocola sp.]
MKREDKNRQTRRRILEGALAEFGQQGYARSSINSLCAAQGISKGIVYHYFETKDVLYLACIAECFDLLTRHLRQQLSDTDDVQTQLERYFSARLAFFRDHPVYQPLFCETVTAPPEHLRTQILAVRSEFDALNREILENLLSRLPLRATVTHDDVTEVFRQFQDIINARHTAAASDPQEFERREASCRRALDILLYGVIERKQP